MYKKRHIELYIISLPILILIAGSIYFTYITWQKYVKDTKLLEQVNKSVLVQSLEHSISNELVCRVTVKKKNQSKICAKIQITTDSLVAQLEQPADESLLFFVHKLVEKQVFDSFSPSMDKLKLLITDIRKNTVSVDKIINGEYQKNIISVIQGYLTQLEKYSDIPKEKELLKFFTRISDISYFTEAEKSLVSYYLSQKIPMTPNNLIYWDKVIWASEFPNINEEEHHPDVKKLLLTIYKSSKLQSILRNIEDTRISILSKASKGIYANTTVEWIALLNQKQKALNAFEDRILKIVLSDIRIRINEQRQILLATLLLSLLSLFFLLYLVRYYRKIHRDNQVFNKVINTIDTLSLKNDKKLVSTSETLKNKEDAYLYIESKFKDLEKKEKQSLKQSEAKNFYLTNMSHEIRTPLSGISGFIDLLKETPLSEDQNDLISHMETNTNQLNSIVSGVLDIAKINAEKMDIKYTSFNIFDQTEAIVSNLSMEADKKDIVLGLFIDPELPNYLMGDLAKLSQVFTNLIGNAIRFTNTYGSVNIFLKQVKKTSKEATIKFIIEDNGVGITNVQMKNIFKPFAQADIDTNRVYGGTGLGLTISQKIIELMGGTLEVTSEEAQGSSFYFTLTFRTDQNNPVKLYPSFEDMHVGLALPVRNIDRQIDKNLEKYITYLGATFKIYYYDELFAENDPIDLPDLMIVYHNYARLEGELESFTALKCKAVLITTNSLRLRIGQTSHTFSDIVNSPMSINKTIRLLRNVKLNNVSILTNSKNIDKFEQINALVAEDNFINQKLIRIVLENLGFEVTLVSNGKEAVDLYKQHKYDMIFMDINMPMMNGIEATKMIIEHEEDEQLKHTPIVALTGNMKKGDKEEFINIGMDHYLLKPINISDIKRVTGEYFPDRAIRKS